MTCTTTRYRSGEEGSILVVTLLIMFAIAVIGSSMSVMSSMDLKISGNQRFTVKAFNVAEAGLNEAIHRISLPNPTNATVGGWTGNVALADAKPYDPNWEARIYLTTPNAAPAGGGSVVTTGTIQDPNGEYLRYSRSSGTEQVLTIRHKWEDLDGDSNRDAGEIVLYDPAVIPPENFISGFPVEVVTVTGRSAGAVRQIEAEVTKRTVLGRTLGALYADVAIEIAGNPGICGYNHDVNTPAGTKPNACLAWHLAGDHLPGVTTTGDDVDITGAAADVLGDPTPTDTSSTNPFYSLAEVLGVSNTELSQILANADNTSIVDPLNGITYIQGNAKINSNLTGQGLLYVTGDLDVDGNLDYSGLIYVGEDLKVTGTPWIIGSVIVKGSADYNIGAGNAAILYSRDAIKNFLGRYMPAIVLSWREL